MSVLCAVLLNNAALREVRDIVRPEDMHAPANAAVYESMLVVSDRGDPIDVVTLEAQLRSTDKLGLLKGGAQYLAKLSDGYTSSHNAVAHARRVRDMAGARRFIEEIRGLADVGDEIGEDPSSWCERALDKLQPLARFGRVGSYTHWADSIRPAIDEANTRRRTGVVPIMWDNLSRLADGWISPDLIVPAARPSFGKTAFAMDCVRHAAAFGIPVLFLSLEMSKTQLVQRGLSSESGVDSKRWRSGHWLLGELETVVRSAGDLHKQPIYIVDDVNEIGQLCALARQWRNDPKVFPRDRRDRRGFIVLDYIQRSYARGYGAKRELEISYISRSLKSLAKELDVPVMALAQLNRAIDTRKGHRPMLSDLRESGAIEQDADTVLFIHRPGRYDKKTPSELTEVIIAKQRNGQTGMVKLDFVDHLVTFVEHVEKPFVPRSRGEDGEV